MKCVPFETCVTNALFTSFGIINDIFVVYFSLGLVVARFSEIFFNTKYKINRLIKKVPIKLLFNVPLSITNNYTMQKYALQGVKHDITLIFNLVKILSFLFFVIYTLICLFMLNYYYRRFYLYKYLKRRLQFVFFTCLKQNIYKTI